MIYSKQFALGLLIAVILPIVNFIGLQTILHPLFFKEQTNLKNLYSDLFKQQIARNNQTHERTDKDICFELLDKIREQKEKNSATSKLNLNKYANELKKKKFTSKTKASEIEKKIGIVQQRIDETESYENFEKKIILFIGLIILTFILILYKRINLYLWSGLFIGFSIIVFHTYYLKLIMHWKPMYVFQYTHILAYTAIIAMIIYIFFIFKPGTILSIALPLLFLVYYMIVMKNERLLLYEEIRKNGELFGSNASKYLAKNEELNDYACLNITKILTKEPNSIIEKKLEEFYKNYREKSLVKDKALQQISNEKKAIEEQIKVFDQTAQAGKKSTLLLIIALLLFLFYLAYFLIGTSFFYGIISGFVSIAIALFFLEVLPYDVYYYLITNFIAYVILTCFVSYMLFNIIKKHESEYYR